MDQLMENVIFGSLFGICNYIVFYLLFKICLYNYIKYHWGKSEAIKTIPGISQKYIDYNTILSGSKTLIASNIIMHFSLGIFVLGAIYNVYLGSILALSMIAYEIFSPILFKIAFERN